MNDVQIGAWAQSNSQCLERFKLAAAVAVIPRLGLQLLHLCVQLLYLHMHTQAMSCMTQYMERSYIRAPD